MWPFTSNDVASVFSAADVSSLSLGCRNRGHAEEANCIIQATRKFVDAYGTRINVTQKTKLICDTEVWSIMDVRQKKDETRTNFASLLQVAHQAHAEMQAASAKMPTLKNIPSRSWNKCKCSSPQRRKCHHEGGERR